MQAMTAAPLSVNVNGTPRQIEPGSTLLELVEALGLRKELIAVELNRSIVSKTEYADRRLEAGDLIEIVEFVGGG
jgi:thiamine biosynthesis protein ThiS